MMNKLQTLIIIILPLISSGHPTVFRLSNFSVVSACSLYQDGSQRSKLTYSQIKELVEYGHPDQFIAREIRERGVDFRLDGNKERELRRLGAGNETIAALKKANP